MKHIRHLLSSLALASCALTGCGVESFVSEALDEEHEPPASTIRGTVALSQGTLRYLQPSGETVEPLSSGIRGNGTYTFKLPSGDYQNGRIEVFLGQKLFMNYVPRLAQESSVKDVALDHRSTTVALIIQAVNSVRGQTVAQIDPSALEGLMAELHTETADAANPAGQLSEMMRRLMEAAPTQNGSRPFNTPSFNEEFAANSPTLSEAFLAAVPLDYDGDGARDLTSEVFDAALSLAVELVIAGPTCISDDTIRVVFEVNFNDGQLDGNCDSIQRFRWVRDEPGKQMFFVGGLHEESPIQDPEVDAILGNTSGWVPNQLQMYDDGSNGDETAGDNIWTVSFDLPVGARMGYKYTWGQQGQLWTGTEEWPGNQRILEIEDINGDDFVRRRDNFGDEATNKDLSNLGRRSGGMVTWDSDHNEDGIPDARERPLDQNNDCMLDDWETPTTLGPVTVSCEE